MNNVSFPLMPLLGRLLLGHVRLVHTKSQPIVIAAAVRTPCGKYQGQLATLNGWQLGQIAVEAAVKRSAIPLEEIHHIFMNETHTLQQKHESKLIFTHFLKKAKYTPVIIEETSEMDSFLTALEFIKSMPQAVAAAGGFISVTNDQNIEYLSGKLENVVSESYTSKSLDAYKRSQYEAVFDSELVPLKIQKQRGRSRIIEEIFQDEIFAENVEEFNKTTKLCDEASAVVLTSVGKAEALKLSPLAVVKGYEYLHNTDNSLPKILQCLDKLLTQVGIQAHQMKHWEIDDVSLVHRIEQNFKLKTNVINPHGDFKIFGYSPVASFTRLLTHISHALNPSEYGCVISSSYRNTSVLIVQKLCCSSVPHHLPLITLYTKNHCPLCDVLVEELELNFSGEYELEKVFIDTKENVRFLRLYRYDIPVVFLNNQFLCMHRLNHRLLRKRLDLLKNKRKNFLH